MDNRQTGNLVHMKTYYIFREHSNNKRKSQTFCHGCLSFLVHCLQPQKNLPHQWLSEPVPVTHTGTLRIIHLTNVNLHNASWTMTLIYWEPEFNLFFVLWAHVSLLIQVNARLKVWSSIQTSKKAINPWYQVNITKQVCCTSMPKIIWVFWVSCQILSIFFIFIFY